MTDHDGNELWKMDLVIHVRVSVGTRQPLAMAFRIKTMSLRDISSVHTIDPFKPQGDFACCSNSVNWCRAFGIVWFE